MELFTPVNDVEIRREYAESLPALEITKVSYAFWFSYGFRKCFYRV